MANPSIYHHLVEFRERRDGLFTVQKCPICLLCDRSFLRQELQPENGCIYLRWTSYCVHRTD